MLRLGEPAYFVFACACIVLIAYEGYLVFLKRPMLRIEGDRPVRIEAFDHGTTASHAFQMNDDGLYAVSMRFIADRPVSVHVLCRLLRLPDAGAPMADNPNLFAAIYRWTDTLDLEAGDHWQRIGFHSVGESRGQWYAFEIRLLDSSQNRPEGQNARAAVSLLASEDNPPRGGKLWIDGVRQPGSLFLRAHGGTKYEQFLLHDEPKLPPVLRNRIVQAALVLIYHWALFTFAFSTVFGTATVRIG
jgi:hypothetical protein